MRILYLASVPALETGASPVVLLRHLKRLSDRHELAYVCDQPEPSPFPRHLRLSEPAWLRVLRRTRNAALAVEFNDALARAYPLAPLRRLLREFQPDLVLTVALGPLHLVARRLAARHTLPLVSLFHDWSPAWFTRSPFARRLYGRQILRTYRDSAVSLCITPEFREYLGPAHPDARVLAPIPAGPPWTGPVGPSPARLAVYAGAVHGIYQPQALALIRALRSRTASRPDILFLGPAPHWPEADLHHARDSGLLGGFLPRPDLELNLASAPALLVTSPFDSRYDAIARYSFPSKIAEYCRFSRPIVLWAPAHSAAAAWARRTSAALLVSEPAPAAVLAALESLANDPVLAATLAARALASASGEFAPDHLQSVLESALHTAFSGRFP